MNRERYMQVCVCGLCDKCKGKQQCPAYRTALNAWDAAVIATRKKACEYLRKEYEQMNRIIDRICIKDKGDLIKVEASIEAFRKYMEE